MCVCATMSGKPVSLLHADALFLLSHTTQVLELAVSPVLDHVASAQVLEECSVFDISRLGQTQLGITGMSLEKTYRCAAVR